MMTAVLQKLERAWTPVSEVLRVPHNDAEYDSLVSVLNQLIDEVGEDQTHPLASLMDVVGVLVEKYEDEHVPELS
jgi:HTH-type transcriptional regulator / antitoxin HigA